jgi:hypothetical protein
VVWKVVGNLIGKIVTAPFKLIGGLFAGSEKAQFVAFAPGSAALPADAKSALEALGKSLAAKPELNLDIPAGSGIREDADALGQQRMAEAAMGKQGGDYAGLADDKKVDRLKPLYKAKFGKSPDFPKGEVKEANFLAGGAAKHEAAASQRQWLEAQLKPKFEPTDAQLAELGQARAAAVKEALLAAGGIDPGRVFISTAKSFQAKDGKVEMELGVK